MNQSVRDSPFPAHVCFAAVHRNELVGVRAHPEEEAALGHRTAPSRREAFVLGREAARRALTELLDSSPPPVLVGRDRAPCWPNGLVGSISHAGGWGVAAVDRTSRTSALGLDVAHLPELHGTEITGMVADADEQRWIGGDPRRLLALFSAKESVFKALYPSCRIFIGFEDVTARWAETPTPGFNVQLLRAFGERWPAGYRLYAGVRWWGDIVLTWVLLPDDACESASGSGASLALN